MSNTIAQIQDISFSYDKVEKVLDNITFDVKSQEFIGILGHNGAGKTTLFKNMLGLLKPNSGQIHVLPKQNKISYLPDRGGYYDSLTVRKNIEFRAELANICDKDTAVTLAIKSVKLDKHIKKYPSQLSSGLQKRLAIACTLISSPHLLLLDEPTVGLDPESIEIICTLLKELNKKGATIMMNTHDLGVVSRFCEKVIILQNGKSVYNSKLVGNEESLRQFYLELTRDGGL